MESIMIKQLLIILILASISFGQGITLGPFKLNESVKESRAVCESMTLVEKGALGDIYTANYGMHGWELIFWDNRLDYITMIYNNYSRQAYETLVRDYSRGIGRNPDSRAVDNNNYITTWRASYRKLQIMYNSDKREVRVRLHITYT
jgi:hypothetical protein